MKRRTFTLVELLVVIAIISILAAMLLPALTRARDQARSVSCLSNFKQLGLAVIGYTMEFGDWMPISEGPDKSGTVRNGHWAREIAPYAGIANTSGWILVEVGDERLVQGVYRCPNLPDSAILQLPGCSAASIYCGLGYGFNQKLGRQDNHATYLPRQKVQQVAKPSTKLLLGDSVDWWGQSTAASSNYYRVIYSSADYGPLPQVGKRHAQGINTVLVDGHAEHFRHNVLMPVAGRAHYTLD